MSDKSTLGKGQLVDVKEELVEIESDTSEIIDINESDAEDLDVNQLDSDSETAVLTSQTKAEECNNIKLEPVEPEEEYPGTMENIIIGAIPLFNGTREEDVAEWLQKFELALNCLDKSTPENKDEQEFKKLHICATKLGGHAYKVYQFAPEENKATFEELKQLLLEKFGEAEDQSIWIQRLMNCYRQNNQDVQEYELEIKTLASKAYPCQEDKEHRDLMAYEQFIRGINNRHMQSKLLASDRKEGKTGKVKAAAKLEKAVEAMRSHDRIEQAIGARHATIDATTRREPAPQFGPYQVDRKQLLRLLGEQVSALKAEVNGNQSTYRGGDTTRDHEVQDEDEKRLQSTLVELNNLVINSGTRSVPDQMAFTGGGDNKY